MQDELAQQNGHPAPMSSGTLDELNKIRDILFGSQAQQLSTTINDLERRVLEMVGVMKADMNARFSQLENQLHQDLATIRIAMDAEQKERVSGDLALDRAFHQKFVQMQETTEQAFAAYGEKLATETQQRIADVATLTQTTHQLSDDKLDRARLAALLQHMAREIAE